MPDGKLTDFRGAVKAQEDEVVVFSWIEQFPSRRYVTPPTKNDEHPRMKALGEMPFDGKRMIFGGFAPILDA